MREGRSLRLTVTDGGLELGGRAYARASAANFPGAARLCWSAIQSDLATTGRTLADLSERPRRADTKGICLPRRANRRPSDQRSSDPKQIRLASRPYLALTGGERAKAVRLSALRTHLRDLDRATVDAGLAAILRGDKTARLSQFSDPRSLDAASARGGVQPRGRALPCSWIQS